MCRFLLPSDTGTYALVWWANKELRMSSSKTLSPGLRTIIQVILISILYVLARMLFFQAHLLKKKNYNKTDRPQPGAHLYNLCRIFFLCIAKQIEHKRQKSKNNIRVALYARKRPGENTSHSKNGTKVAKMAILRRLYQSKMVYTGTDPQNTENIQKLSSKIIRVAPCRKLLNFRRMTRR